MCGSSERRRECRRAQPDGGDGTRCSCHTGRRSCRRGSPASSSGFPCSPKASQGLPGLPWPVSCVAAVLGRPGLPAAIGLVATLRRQRAPPLRRRRLLHVFVPPAASLLQHQEGSDTAHTSWPCISCMRQGQCIRANTWRRRRSCPPAVANRRHRMCSRRVPRPPATNADACPASPGGWLAVQTSNKRPLFDGSRGKR